VIPEQRKELRHEQKKRNFANPILREYLGGGEARILNTYKNKGRDKGRWEGKA